MSNQKPPIKGRTVAPQELSLALSGERETLALGAKLSQLAGPADCICLWGDLGAGKTTLARGLIRALAEKAGEPQDDVPSPTFPIVQTYEFGDTLVFHFDLYRIANPGDLIEVGFEDALDAGVVLVEWPDRAGSLLPPDRLDIYLELAGPSGRQARLVGSLKGCGPHHTFGDAMTVQPALVADDRETVIRDFLDKAGWGTAKRVPLTADASTRRYERLVKDGTTALLMDAPPAAESAPCPPDASPQQRIDLGYNAVARLAGPDSRRFAAFSAELRRLGLSAPEVYDAEYDAGLLLIEDLGDDLFARAMKAGQAETPLYEAAVDVLLHLHGQPAPHMVGGTGAPESPLLDYDTLALGAEADLLH